MCSLGHPPSHEAKGLSACVVLQDRGSDGGCMVPKGPRRCCLEVLTSGSLCCTGRFFVREAIEVLGGSLRPRSADLRCK